MTLLDRLRGWVKSRSALHESDSKNDGAFSYSGEWHSFAVGAGVGFASVMPVPKLKRFVFDHVLGLDAEAPRTAALKEARREGWYALGGVLFGAVLAVACLLGVAGAATVVL